MNHQRPKKAFTLVEVLVVIVIIGIMGAMVTTAVSGVTTTAKQSRTKTIISIDRQCAGGTLRQLEVPPTAR